MLYTILIGEYNLKKDGRETTENYLKAIFILSEEMENEYAKTSDLATFLGVSQPSVSEMLQKLAKSELIEYIPRKGARLSFKGRKIIYKLIRRHRLAERLLTDVLKISPEKIDQIACKMEHIIDEEMEEKLDAFLKYPETCPHGAPIPRNNKIAKTMGIMLSKAKEGSDVFVIRFLDESEETIILLKMLGIEIGKKLRIVKRISDASMLIKVNGTNHLISPRLASSIVVKQLEQEK